MEPTAQGRTEKSFSYVVRAPGGDRLDVTHVDVKIDTCWLFRDLEESDEAWGCLPEGAEGPEVDAAVLRKQLASSERKPEAAVGVHTRSESRLRSRIQELELSEGTLLQEVARLRARMVQERGASLRAQEQLRALRGELASQVREEESVARRQRQQLRRLTGLLRSRDEALGLQAAALERCWQIQRCQLGLVRDQECVLRVQVQRLERDVRRLCGATGLLLARRGTAAPAPVRGKPQLQVPADPPKDPEAAAELRCTQERAQRSERELKEAEQRLHKQRAAERWLRGQLEELRCCIYGLQLSEIGLQGQVEELAQQNRSLREELGAQAPAGGCSLDGLRCVQEDSPSLPGEDALDPCGSQGQHGGAQGPRASAGQLLEGPHARISTGARPGPESTGELSEDHVGSVHEQPPLAEPGVDRQVLLLVCDPSPAQHTDGPLVPLDLAWTTEGLAVPPAQEPFLQLQTSMLPLWGLAGVPGPLQPLLLQEPPREELQDVLGARPPPGPSAVAHPSWHRYQPRSLVPSPCQRSPRTSDHPLPVKGSKQGKDTCSKEGGAPEGGAGDGEVRTWSKIEGELGGQCQPAQENCEDLSLGSRAHSPLAGQGENVALETPAITYCPWLWQECPEPLLQVEDSMEEPESLSRRQSVAGCGWGASSSEKEEAVPPATRCGAHGTSESQPAGGELPAGRQVCGKEDGRPWCASALLPQGESPGVGGQKERGLHQEASSLGNRGVPQELDSQQCKDRGTLVSVGQCGSLQPPRLAVSGEDPGPPRAPGQGQDGHSLPIDAFEREVEACFQLLNILTLGSRGHRRETSRLAGANWGFAQRSGGEEGGEGTTQEQTVAPGTSRALPGGAPDWEEGSQGPAELHGNLLSSAGRALEGARATCHQLLSSLKKERGQVSWGRAAPREDQERHHCTACDVETDGVQPAAQVSQLQQANRILHGELASLRGKLDQYGQAMSGLEECNRESYVKISDLEEENENLKRDLAQLQRTMSKGARKSCDLMERVTLENRELKALISELGAGYEELIRDVVLGVEDMIRALKGENEHLLHRVRALEQEVTLQTSGDRGRSLGGAQRPQESTVVAVDKVCTLDKEVQATPLLGQLVTSACGAPLEEAVGVPGAGTGPALDLQGSRRGADSPTASLVWRNTEGPSVLRGKGRGGAAHVETEEKRPRRSQQGLASRPLSSGSQLQDAGAEASQEDPRLCVRQLRHQVQTLQCQLRDQRWSHWQLQVARVEALHLQEELKGKLEELQREQHEARLAVAPLKAKLASLVQKCQERSCLITQLLRELHRHGATDLVLSERAWNMVHDVALSEYAAAFLTPGLPETSRSLGAGSQDTAAARAQGHLLSSETPGALRSSSRSESWPVPEAAWPAQTAPLDSQKEAHFLLSLGTGSLIEDVHSAGPPAIALLDPDTLHPALASSATPPNEAAPALGAHPGSWTGAGGSHYGTRRRAPSCPTSPQPPEALQAPEPREDPGFSPRAQTKHLQQSPVQ